MRPTTRPLLLSLACALSGLGLTLAAAPADAKTHSGQPLITRLSARPALLGASGGVVTVTARVRAARSCNYTLGTRRGTVSCADGHVSLRLRLAANSSTHTRSYRLTLSAAGAASRSTTVRQHASSSASDAANGAVRSAAAPPVAGLGVCAAGADCDYGPIYASYNSYDNAPPQSIGDCTFAAAATWEQIVLGVHASPAIVEQEFSAASGGTTSGISQAGLWSYWTASGIGGVLLTGLHSYFTDRTDVQAGVRRFGAMIVEFHFADGAQFAQYTVSAGYHDAVVDGFTPKGPLVVSWGQTLQLTWQRVARRRDRHVEPDGREPVAALRLRGGRSWTKQAANRRRATCRSLRARHPDGEQQRDAVEEVGEPDGGAGQLQPLDAGGEHVDRDEGAPDVEAPAAELGRAEERGRERRQQVPRADRRVAGGRWRAGQHAGERRDHAAGERAHARSPREVLTRRAAPPRCCRRSRRRAAPSGVRSSTYQTISATTSVSMNGR